MFKGRGIIVLLDEEMAGSQKKHTYMGDTML
jgi:hypothetical protein